MKWNLLAPLLLGAATLFAADPRPAKSVIVMFGDSTTAEQPGAVKKVYSQRVDELLYLSRIPASIRNAGIAGNTTADGRERFDRDVLAHSPRVVVIQFGVNDSAIDVWKSPPATGPRVPMAEYEENLRWMIATLRKQKAMPILMTADPIRWTSAWKSQFGKPPYRPDDPDGFDAPALGPFNAVVRRIAKELHVPLVDVHDVFMARNPDALLLDGMHPNDEGHKLVAELLAPVIRSQLADNAGAGAR